MTSLSQDTKEIQQSLKEGAKFHMKATLSTSDPPSAPHITADHVQQEKNPSRLAYDKNITKPAGKTFLPADLNNNEITKIIPGRAWVVSNVLNSDECEDWIARGEAAGIFAPPSKKQYLLKSEAAGNKKTARPQRDTNRRQKQNNKSYQSNPTNTCRLQSDEEWGTPKIDPLKERQHEAETT